jgi:hypothetical protein
LATVGALGSGEVVTVSLPSDIDTNYVFRMTLTNGEDVGVLTANITEAGLEKLDHRYRLVQDDMGIAVVDPADWPTPLSVLTDGLSNPRPASEAVERAAEAKAEGVVIHTIGLGDTLDFKALEAMASRPDDSHRAPDGEDLAAIYAQIAVEIPCPPSRYWGRR